MGYAEFPHMNYEDTDFHELIQMIRELRGNYKGTLDKIEALTTRLDEYEKNVDSRIDNAVNSAISQYKASVSIEISNKWSQIEADINKWKFETATEFNEKYNTLAEEVDHFTAQTSALLIEFERKINNNHVQMINAIDNYFASINEEYSNFAEELTSHVNNQIEYIKGTLPMEIKSINWLWENVLQTGGFNCMEWYNSQDITCEEWNRSGITCEEWYTNGKSVFDWYNKIHKMISPVSGEIVTAQKAIVELASALKINAITAGEYDAMRITADKFDNMFSTAGAYDWSGDLLYKLNERSE